MKSCNGYWSDHEWAVYLGVSERTVRNYFREGIILGAEQNDAGEWWAASTGMSRYRTFQNMAVHRRWKRDEFGDFEDPRLSETLKQAFGPLYAARRKRILRRAKMWRIASAHSRAMRQEAFEMKKLDDLEESARWMLSANSRLKQLHELKMGLLKDYLPSPSSIAFIKRFHKQGLMGFAELLVAALSAINEDGLKQSNNLPSCYSEWVKIRGFIEIEPSCKNERLGHDFHVWAAVKPNKASESQFRTLMRKHGRKDVILAAKRMHPDGSDIFCFHQEIDCHEGAAHWQLQRHEAMDWTEVSSRFGESAS